MKKILIVSIIALSLCGCNQNTVEDNTNNNRKVYLTDEDNEQLLEDILHFIENTGSGKELKMFEDSMVISTEDIITGVGIKNYNYYISSNSAYLQIDNLMYRFQFNSNGEVVSYIKYTVEA